MRSYVQYVSVCMCFHISGDLCCPFVLTFDATLSLRSNLLKLALALSRMVWNRIHPYVTKLSVMVSSYLNFHWGLACHGRDCLLTFRRTQSTQPTIILPAFCNEAADGPAQGSNIYDKRRTWHECQLTNSESIRVFLAAGPAPLPEAVQGVTVVMKFRFHMQVGIFEALHWWPLFKQVPKGSWRSLALQAIDHRFHKQECETV